MALNGDEKARITLYSKCVKKTQKITRKQVKIRKVREEKTGMIKHEKLRRNMKCYLKLKIDKKHQRKTHQKCENA